VKSEEGTELHVSDKKIVSLIDFYGFEIVLFYCTGRKCKVITERGAIFCYSSYQLNK
jgi:hypothetical protein